MDTVPLVENQIDSGQRFIDRLQEEEIVVRTACWVKPVEKDRWTLYIATPSVDEKGTLEAYRQVRPALQSLGEGWLTSSDLTLVSEKHPLVPYADDILQRYPHKKPIRAPRLFLGGISIEELFVYPLGKTMVTIYHLVFPGAPEGGSLSLDSSLLDGHFSMGVESQGQRKVYQGQTGVHCIVAAPEGATLQHDAIGETLLVWDYHGKRMQSDANEVWSLAKLGLHGFRVCAKQPDPGEE